MFGTKSRQRMTLQYLDFDLDIGEGSGREYRVNARSSAGEARAIMRFPYDELALGEPAERPADRTLESGATQPPNTSAGTKGRTRLRVPYSRHCSVERYSTVTTSACSRPGARAKGCVSG